MRRRDVIQALCSLLGVGTLATRRVRAAAPRQILLARLHVAGTAYYDAEAAADRLRPGQRLALRRQPENRYEEGGVRADDSLLGRAQKESREVARRLAPTGTCVSPVGPRPEHPAEPSGSVGCTRFPPRMTRRKEIADRPAAGGAADAGGDRGDGDRCPGAGRAGGGGDPVGPGPDRVLAGIKARRYAPPHAPGLSAFDTGCAHAD